jgi:multidrug resistance efflux pump
MIKQLTTRNRVDKFKNDVRAPSAGSKVRWSRYVYLACLLSFFAFIANILFGSYVWLRADGLISADRSVVRAAYEAQVVRIDVAPGQRVLAGQSIGQVFSPRLAEQMAVVSARLAELQSRSSELRVRLQTAQALVAVARDRKVKADEVLQRVERLRREGMALISHHSVALNDHYTATQEKTRNEVELRVMRQQLDMVRVSQQEAGAALAELKRHHNHGSLVAPTDGMVGPQVAKVGDIVSSSEHAAEVLAPPAYVLAYLETGTLYKVRPGNRVKVVSGFNEGRGTVTEVLPMTVRLPGEFQKAFSAAGQGQVAKITLDPGQEEKFPMFGKVRVTSEDVIDREAVHAQLDALKKRWNRVREAVVAKLSH